MVALFANSGDPDQMLHSAASDLGQHCLPFTLLGVSSLQWVKYAESTMGYVCCKSDYRNPVSIVLDMQGYFLDGPDLFCERSVIELFLAGPLS